VWWFGIVAVLTAFATVIRKRNLYVPVFLLVAMAAQYVPWMLVSRLTFIYHFFPSLPFMILLIVWFFRYYIKKPAIMYAYAGVVFAMFALFYPVLSGLPMNVEFVRKWLAWLPGWVFM
jgi:dolichyl-phosphate-mannose--protein O-mannosyl transferase